ncbi:MAG: restriction endonuclease subunit S [Armatimonadetes bacterium]|nr:restriction endonuclease subunit S [Armatimonadota bacterium]
MKAGQHLSATAIASAKSSESRFPVYGGNGLRGYGRSASHTGKYLLIGRQGALCGNVKRASGEFYATEHAVVTEPSDAMDVDFAYYMLTSMNLNKFKSSGAQPGLAVGNLAEVLVPVPPIEEQKRIADLLDKFDALVNDLSSGLPAELNARRQQYEYYRDKLLTFQEATA